MEGIFGPNEKEDHSNTGESGEEGNENSTSGKCQETKWPRSTGGLSPCPRLRPLSPTTKTASAREAKTSQKQVGQARRAVILRLLIEIKRIYTRLFQQPLELAVES